MVLRKCRKCDAVWRGELKQCAFCGQDGEEEDAAPQVAVAVLERPATNGSPKALEPVTKLPGSFVTSPPPAPRLPSALVPPVFAILGLAAAGLLPAGFLLPADRITSVLIFLGVALLVPFAPLAWWAGWRYQARCALLGFRPSAAARAGGVLGIAATLLVALEGSALAFLRALQHLQE